jgi:hypothetical protein
MEERRLSLTSSVRRRGAITHERKEREDEAVLWVRLHFQSISEGLGSETSHAVAGIRERPRGIRAEFWA